MESNSKPQPSYLEASMIELKQNRNAVEAKERKREKVRDVVPCYLLNIFIYHGSLNSVGAPTPKGSYPVSLLSQSSDRRKKEGERENVGESGRFFLFVDPIELFFIFCIFYHRTFLAHSSLLITII